MKGVGSTVPTLTSWAENTIMTECTQETAISILTLLSVVSTIQYCKPKDAGLRLTNPGPVPCGRQACLQLRYAIKIKYVPRVPVQYTVYEERV